MNDSVYEVVELIGSSSDSWEMAAQNAVRETSRAHEDLRVAEVVEMDVLIEAGSIIAYGVCLELVEAPGTVAMSEVPGPPGKIPVESPDDRGHWGCDQRSGGEFTYPLPGFDHCPFRWPAGQEPQATAWGFDPPMMESQEIEPLPVGQVHDRGLVGMRSQPEFGEFVFEHGESPLRLGARAAHDHEIICVAHELPEPAM